MSTDQTNGLEIDVDLDFQERAWRVENAVWGLLVLIVILALLGLFGTGPLSSATAGGEARGLTVRYERFLRDDGEASLQIEVAPDRVTGGTVELWIGADYLAEAEDIIISPDPDEVRSEGSAQVYVFLVDTPNAPIPISFAFRPATPGRLSGEIGIVGGDTVTFTQFTYP